MSDSTPFNPNGRPRLGSRWLIEHDGFRGTVIGHYQRLDGRRGVNLQLDNAQVVHCYGEKWLTTPLPDEDDHEN